MVLSPEGFFAYVTRVRSLVRVGPLVYQQIVALSELSVAETAYELFLGSRRPADTGDGADGRGSRPCGHRPECGWSRARCRAAEQRRRGLTAILAARVQEKRVRIAALLHDRLEHFVLVQRHGHQFVLLLLVEQRDGCGRGCRGGVCRRRRRRLLRLLLLLLRCFVLGHVHARRRLLLLLLLQRQVVVLEYLVFVRHHRGGKKVGGRRRRERRNRRVTVKRAAGRHDRHERRAHARLHAFAADRSRLTATASARHRILIA